MCRRERCGAGQLSAWQLQHTVWGKHVRAHPRSQMHVHTGRACSRGVRTDTPCTALACYLYLRKTSLALPFS